jgi:hypothetical protein
MRRLVVRSIGAKSLDEWLMIRATKKTENVWRGTNTKRCNNEVKKSIREFQENPKSFYKN